MSKYYYHGCELEVMKEIIKCGKIKTQRDLGYKEGFDFNGLDYVSLCCKLPDNEYSMTHLNDAYSIFIKNRNCFIVSDRIEVFKTTYIDWKKLEIHYYTLQQYIKKHSDKRWTDMIDEYQVKGSISLNYIIGIGLLLSMLDNPLSQLNKNELEILNYIINMAINFKWDIINTNDDNFIEKYEMGIKKDNDSEHVYSLLKKYNK